MEKERSHPHFDQLVKEADYSLLERYERPDSWKGLSATDRELVAILFVWRANADILDGAIEVIGNLKLAQELAPSGPKALYWQGVFWLRHFDRTGDVAELEQACECFCRAAKVEEEFGPVWCAWGVALTKLGVANQDLDCLSDAENKFEKATGLLEDSDAYMAELLWDWAECCCRSGELSQEACDFKRAIDLFQRAAESGQTDAIFSLDYGHALVALADRIGDWRLLSRAVGCYLDSVKADNTNGDAWHSLGVTLFQLYEITGDEHYFLKAYEAFEMASAHAPDMLYTWLDWAGLLFLAGGRHPNEKTVALGLEKIEKALELGPDDQLVISESIRGLTLLGRLGERLDHLKEAEMRAEQGVTLYSSSPDLWCRYGEVLAALGCYFDETKHYRHAMEKFAYALALDQNFSAAHYGMARTALTLGYATGEISCFEKASKHLNRVVLLQPTAADAWNQWGVALLKRAEMNDSVDYVEDAITKFKHAIDLRGGIEGSPDTEALYNYGCALDFFGTFGDEEEPHRQAIDVLMHVDTLQPKDSAVLYQLGLAWFHLGELTADIDYHERACDHFRMATDIDPDEAVAWDEWGCALLCLGQFLDDPSMPHRSGELFAESEEKLHHAASLGCGEAHYHLAWLYTHLKQYDTAVHFLRRAASQRALPPLDHLLHDDWLSDLRNTRLFREFLEEITNL